MPNRPRVFIGSSNEAKDWAGALNASLLDFADSTPWYADVFEAGSHSLTSLISQTKTFDFAVLIVTPDDRSVVRGVEGKSPRNNIVFEIGLFIGLLGMERTFFVCHDAETVLPTDLDGLTRLRFTDHPQGRESALAGVVEKLKNAFRRLERRDTTDREEEVIPLESPSSVSLQRAEEHGGEIAGTDAAPPSLDAWYRNIRPHLPQSTYYTTPTYYLDTNYQVIGWNIAFGLVFERIAHRVLYQHVKRFIAELVNWEQVFDHGKQFTENLKEGLFPYCDSEELEYLSEKYGIIRMAKIATQLHNNDGQMCGWTVALFPQSINWTLFQEDLRRVIDDEKLWSVYATAYDRILSDFLPYRKLLGEVADAIPSSARRVIDIGAGTGNSTRTLLDRGFQFVTAVEYSNGMIDKIRSKKFDANRLRVVKARAESVGDVFKGELGTFDGATMVNVLYSVERPYECLVAVHSLLKPGGRLGLSTTHSETSLTQLLESIERHVLAMDPSAADEDAFVLVRDINRRLERVIARRVSVERYRELVTDAGFEITKLESSYEGAVIVIHAVKK